MSDWTSGYIADIGYTFGYYTELNPLRARLAFLNARLVPPKFGCHCELGFGQGLSVIIHAAASGNEWYATDFNPAQVGFARELASVSGATPHLYDEAFSEFCHRPDLPEFDSIGLHGIWSWISDDNRSVIVDFIRRKLKVGGVLYISYNTQPGWAATVPLRDLLTEHAEVMGVSGKGIVSRIDEALAFADKLMAVNPAYARVNPQALERLTKLKEHDRHYLAHEYFNRDWLPMPFSRMAEWLAPAKLNFACSAYYPDHRDGLNLSTEQQALIKEIPDPMFRETVRDFCVNQQFRRDYWVKGARKLSAVDHQGALRATRVILAAARADVSLKVTGSLGEANMQEAVYGPILDALADHQVRTLGEIERAVAGKANLAQLQEAAIVLANSGSVLVAQDEAAIAKAKPYCARLTAHLIDKARGSKDIGFLASPVTGGGIAVNRFQQLFLMAMGQGKEEPAAWADFLWDILASQDERLLKDGKVLDTAEANLAELNKQAVEFAEKRLAVLKALHIA